MTMSRRANGEGTVFRTAEGQWKVSLSVRDSLGRRRRITRNAKSKADAAALLAKLRGESHAAAINKETETVAHAMTVWLEKHVATNRAPATLALYRSMADRIIVPRVGGIALQRLTTQHVQAFVDCMISDKVTPRQRQVSLAVLRACLRFAKKTGLITTDPTAGVETPQHDAKDMRPFTRVEVARLLDHVKHTRWHALLMVAFSTGMRQGELFGLTWDAVDLTAGRIKVMQAAAEVNGTVTIRRPKTKGSVRTIELAAPAVVALQDHLDILQQEGNLSRNLVFPAPQGGLIPRSTFRHRYWLRWLKALGLDPRGFHNTRHTFATLALGEGVPVHVVSSIMGHTKASTTLDIYAHVLQAQQDAATRVIGRLFGT